MTNRIQFYKVTTLSGTLQPDSFYFVNDGGDYAESYLTNSAGVAKSVGNSTMITNIAGGAAGNFRVVDTIAARNSIDTGDVPFLVLVADATADETVDTGGALYAWKPDAGETGEFRKIAEYESMDIDFSALSINWSQLTDGPVSTPAQIDTAVSGSHTHSNMTELNKIGENIDGYLTYDGQVVRTLWEETNW